MEKKLSFSIASSSSNPNRKKATPKPSAAANFTDADSAADRDSNDKAKHFVTEFDASKTLAETSRKKLVIPPKENEWRPYKKMKNLELPLDAAGKQNSLDFELEVPEIESDEKVSYGLNLRENSNGTGGKSHSADGEKIVEVVKPKAVENMLLEKLRSDLERLPEDRGMAEFDDVPVEGFGAALLAGYGWVEGRGIGKNAKEDVKVKEFTKRTGKEGLGFHDDKYVEARKEDQKRDRQEERKNDRKEVEEEFVVRNRREQDKNEEELVVRERTERAVVMEEAGMIRVGDEARIVAGRRDVGVKGRVLEIVGRDKLFLKDSVTGEELKVRVSDVALLGSREEEECVRKLREMKLRSSKEKERRVKEHRVKGRREEPEKSSRQREEKGGGYRRKEEGTSQIRWLANNIKVRIISKDVKGGRVYCKKGTVVDVVGPTVCDIFMDDTRELVQGVDQRLLETALPRPGGPILVLYGQHKGVYGTLLERDRESETGVVRDADTHALLTVDLEQIAEYVGDPADLE